jgi:RAB protein geranylgeranyltransferase component A
MMKGEEICPEGYYISKISSMLSSSGNKSKKVIVSLLQIRPYRFLEGIIVFLFFFF